MKRSHGISDAKVREAIKAHGPVTVKQIAEHTGLCQQTVRHCLYRMERFQMDRPRDQWREGYKYSVLGK